MARKQMNIRLDELTRAAIKRLAEQYNMSESQVITRAVILLEQELKSPPKRGFERGNQPDIPHQDAE